MENLYLLLGSNSGDRIGALAGAESSIQRQIGRIINKSALYSTQPWGFESETHFLNQVLQVKTTMSPHEILKTILKIETALGRKRGSVRYESRIIDIDILLYGDLLLNNPDLQIPHPRMHQRKFTLAPLAEIAGQLVHPLLQKKINQLYKDCEDKMKVEVYNENY